MPKKSDPVADTGSSWCAQLDLRYSPGTGRTILSECKHFGPLTVQKPFYPEGDICHTYILHPPGGMAPGDQLQLNVHVDTGARALLTTPAAGKCYRSDGRATSLHQHLTVSEGASLEWLPQENIFFKACNAELSTRVDLADAAKFIGWEMVCLGRPASKEQFTQGRVRQRFELFRQGKPLLLERGLYEGGTEALTAAWGLGGQDVMATLVAVGADDSCLNLLRDVAFDKNSGLAAFTLIDDILVCRYLGAGAEAARNYLIKVWQCARPLLLQRDAQVPRIWNT